MFPHGSHRVGALAYHPSRALVCTAGHDSNLKLWSASGADALSLPPGVKAQAHAADAQHWTCAAVRPPLGCAVGVFAQEALADVQRLLALYVNSTHLQLSCLCLCLCT